MNTIITTATSLKQLAATLNSLREQAAAEQQTTFHGAEFDLDALGIDVTGLPTFGGEEPADTTGIYSWDEKNVMVERNDGGFMIKPRATDE